MNLSTTPVGQPEWLRVKEACDYSRLCRPKLDDLRNRGLLRYVALKEEGQSPKKDTRLIDHVTPRTFLESRAVGGEGGPVTEPDPSEKGTSLLTLTLSSKRRGDRRWGSNVEEPKDVLTRPKNLGCEAAKRKGRGEGLADAQPLLTAQP